MPELLARVEERGPYIVVAFQECERMNVLTREIRRSLQELDLGLKVRGTARGHSWTPRGDRGEGSGDLESCPIAI